MLVLKRKPVLVPVVVVKHMYVDPSQPLNLFEEDFSKSMGLNSREPYSLIQQKSMKKCIWIGGLVLIVLWE